MFLEDVIPLINGFNLSTHKATASFNYGSFGGNWPEARAANVLAINTTTVDSWKWGPRFTFAVTHEVLGGHENGPSETRAGMWILVRKKNPLTSDKTGELDGAYILAEQNNKDDVGGLILGVSKVFGGVGDTGGAVGVEFDVSRLNPDGDVTEAVHGVLGYQPGLGDPLGGRGAGCYVEASAGIPRAGYAVVNYGGTFIHFFAAYTDRDENTKVVDISWDGQPFMRLGVPNDNMQMRYDASIQSMVWRDQSGSTNAGVLSKAGEFAANQGVRVSSDSDLIRRVHRKKISIDFPYIPPHEAVMVDEVLYGAQVDDTCIVNPSVNYADHHIIITGIVIAHNLIRLRAHNIGNAGADPASQDIIVTTIGF